MLNIFRKKNKVTDISWLGVDMHSHILPGIDDGAPDVAHSVRYVKALQELGFNQLICTPHIFKGLYPNTPATISQAENLLRDELINANISINLSTGAEYMIDHNFSHEEALCPIRGEYLLIEMRFLVESPNISQAQFDIEVEGYKPILAHPERYTYYYKDLSRLKRLKEKGCLLQLNLLSVLGYYGRDVKKLADILLKEKMYDFAGTDLHSDKHLHTLTESVRSGRLYDLIGTYDFRNQEVFNTPLQLA